MNHQEKFEQNYITSTEICRQLDIPRTTVVLWKKNGKLPNAIELPGSMFTIWEREFIKPYLLTCKKALDQRRHIN